MKTFLAAVVSLLVFLPQLAAFDDSQPQTPTDLYIRSYTAQMQNQEDRPENAAEIRAQAINNIYSAYDQDHRLVRRAGGNAAANVPDGHYPF